MLDILITILAGLCSGQSSQTQTLALKRFEVIRIESAGLNRLPRSLRVFIAGPVPDRARPVGNVEEAARQLDFVPRLPAMKKPPELLITDRVQEDAKITVS